MMKIFTKKRKFFLIFLLLFVTTIFLRFAYAKISPPSPYWEEVALGYDAYSIEQTGKDHHGNAWPIVAFESFGDWKPSLYFYSMIPFVHFLGLTLEALRLPSRLAGVAIVFGVAFLVSQLMQASQRYRKYHHWGFFIAAFLTALAPWAVMFSRAAWESNLATALVLWAVNFFLLFGRAFDEKKKNHWLFLLLSVLFFVASMYCYHATRMSAPLIAFLLALSWWRKEKTWRSFVTLLPAAAFALLLLLPILFSLQSNVTQQRFAETSIFSNLELIEKSNLAKSEAGNTVFARFRYHRYWYFAGEIGQNVLKHFSPSYLFLHGDPNPRHSSQVVGEFYWLDAAFFLLAIFLLIRRRFELLLPLACAFLAILPASLTTATPHALRSLLALPFLEVLLSFSVLEFFLFIRKKNFSLWFLAFCIFLYIAQTFYFFQDLIRYYPQRSESEWQYGYQQLFQTLEPLAETGNPVFVSREIGRPAMYLWFYSKMDPRLVQAADAAVPQDQAEFLQFANWHFVRDWSELRGQKAAFVALTAKENESFLQNFADLQLKEIGQILSLEQKPIWFIYQLGN
jgi:hypothetical protein